MTHMRYRSSQLCCNTMQLNVSASIFHRRPDGTFAFAAGSVLQDFEWTWSARVEAIPPYLTTFLHPQHQANLLLFCELLGEVYFAGVQRVVCTSSKLRLSFFDHVVSYNLDLPMLWPSNSVALYTVVICVFDDHDCECPIRKKICKICLRGHDP